MGFGGALLAMSAVQAVSQIGQGYAQKAEAKANASMVMGTANYNASLLEGKGQVIDLQKDISSGQYARMRGQYMGKSTAAVAGSGIGLQGSAMAVMLDTQTQINIDEAIANFNFEQEKNYTMNAAAETRRQGTMQADTLRRAGKQAVNTGYSNAFSTLLSGASSYAMYKGGGKLTTTGGPKDTTFDSVYSQRANTPGLTFKY